MKLYVALLLILCTLLPGCSGDDPVQPEPIPSIPREIGSESVTPTSVTLTWKTPSEAMLQESGKSGNGILALAGYKLSYADTTITGINKAATSYTVTGLAPNTNYTFSLKALNSEGEESVAAIFSVATPPLPPPASPTNFRTVDIHATEIELAWTASTSASWSDFAGYILSYGAQDIELASTATSYTATGLAEGTLYTFALVARTADGRSSISVSTSATTHDNTPPPAPPSGLLATATSSTEIRLQWTASPDAGNSNFDKYELAYEPGGSSQPIAIGKEKTSYTVGELTAGTVYTFTLRARTTTGKASSDASISWAPARISPVIRLYGSKSTMGAGVDFEDNTGQIRVLTIADGGDWDLAFDDSEPMQPAIGSPAQTIYVDNSFTFPNGALARRTYVSTNRYSDITNLEDMGDPSPLFVDKIEQLQIINSNKGFAFVVQTEEGNYAKVLVLAKNGKVIQGSGNDTYIEVQISYQPTPNVPYAIIPSGKSRKAEPAATRQIRPSR